MSKMLLLLLALLSPFAQAGTLKVVCLGDSLSEGLGVSQGEAWPVLAEAILKKNFPIEIINRSVSGSTTASGLGRLKWLLKGGMKPDLLILELGANDGLRGLNVQAMKKNLAAVIDYAMSQQIDVMLVGMQMPPNYGKAYADDFRKVYQELAKAKKVTFVPFLLEGVAANPELNQADGIHPNAKGHAIMAQMMVRHLEKKIKHMMEGKKHARH